MLDHITRIVQDYLQQEAIEVLPWSAMSPDMNLIKHLWDYLGRKVSKHSGIRDCFGSGMATVPSTPTATLDSRNEEKCSGTVQDARWLYSSLTIKSNKC